MRLADTSFWVALAAARDRHHGDAVLLWTAQREYSFVDATSFALMRRLRVREALAFDGDFSAAGYLELRP